MSELDDLAKLAALRNAGAITMEEFDNEKQRLGIGLSETQVEAIERATAQRKRATCLLIVVVIIGVVLTLFLVGIVSVSTVDDPKTAAANITSTSLLVDEYNRQPSEIDDKPARRRAGSSTMEEPFTAYEQRLIEQARDAWAEYRGGDGDREKAYDAHSVLLSKLFGRGICWGRGDQPQAEYDYHRCAADSIQMQPPEPMDGS